MTLIESPICDAAVVHLKSLGWTVSCEIPLLYRSIDIVAEKDGVILGIEAKKGFTRKLQEQLFELQMSADQVIVVIGSKPSATNFAWAQRAGIGIWIVRGNSIETILQPGSQKSSPYYRAMLLRNFTKAAPSDFGGLPHRKGIGPAQNVQKQVDEFLRKNPRATWKEIYEKVPNHYVGYRSMRSSLRSNEKRLFKQTRQQYQ